MQSISFTKYTSFGNNFVILDETEKPQLEEADKKRFAAPATDVCFGIGSDNFLVVQPCTRQALNKINKSAGYWEQIPEENGADYVFRMFEPDGTEAYSCGNGLMCIAKHLYLRYGIRSSRIMTEIPSGAPKVVNIGVDEERNMAFADLGHPRRMPSDMADPSIREPLSDAIDAVHAIRINRFREADGIRFFQNQTEVSITGYTVFTGEPHFVLFTDTGFSMDSPGKLLFPGGGGSDRPSCEKRLSTGTDLIKLIGNYFIRFYSGIFPQGISINFVHAIGEDTLEYRCFERGINRETLACGTGALACAVVAKKLGVVNGDRIRLLPFLCRLREAGSEIMAHETPQGWRLFGRPRFLIDGVFSSELRVGNKSRSLAA